MKDDSTLTDLLLKQAGDHPRESFWKSYYPVMFRRFYFVDIYFVTAVFFAYKWI